MKTFQRFFAILLVAASAAGLVAACGSSNSNECLADSDCGSGQLCDSVTGNCAFSCTQDSDCNSGEICVTRSEGGAICIADTGNNNQTCTADSDCQSGETCNNGTCQAASTTCTADADCQSGETCNNGTCQATGGCTTTDDCTGDQICVAGACTTPSTQYYYAQVLDVTDTSSTLCTNPDTNDPGSDIFGVELTKSDGSSYWAYSEWSDSIKATDESGNTNEHADAATILDGNAPGLNADSCPTESFSNSVVSLGCGGSVIVAFVDSSGNPVQIENNDTITVYEWGAQCQSSPASEQDQWELDLCDATDNDVAGGTCNPITLNSGTGISEVTVTTGN